MSEKPTISTPETTRRAYVMLDPRKIRGVMTDHWRVNGYVREAKRDFYLGSFRDKAEAESVARHWEKTGEKPEKRKSGAAPQDPNFPLTYVHPKTGRIMAKVYFTHTYYFGNFKTREAAQAAGERRMKLGQDATRILDENGKWSWSRDPEVIAAHRERVANKIRARDAARKRLAAEGKPARPVGRPRIHPVGERPKRVWKPRARKSPPTPKERPEKKPATFQQVAAKADRRKYLDASQKEEVAEKTKIALRRKEALRLEEDRQAAEAAAKAWKSSDFVFIFAGQEDLVRDLLPKGVYLAGEGKFLCLRIAKTKALQPCASL